MSEGAGKKRFVTVTRTRRTCMPSPSDRLRVIKLTGDGDEEISEHATSGRSEAKARRKEQTKRKNVVQSAKSSNSSPNCPERGLSKKRGGKKKSRIASHSQPVCFVSGSAMQCDGIAVVNVGLAAAPCGEQGAVGAFEAHTKGFGSKMMAKMGFAGGGLGKDGQGMTGLIEVIQRPKSLGLGALLFPPNGGDLEKKNTQSPSMGNNLRLPIVGEPDRRTRGFRSKTTVTANNQYPVGAIWRPKPRAEADHATESAPYY